MKARLEPISGYLRHNGPGTGAVVPSDPNVTQIARSSLPSCVRRAPNRTS